MPLQPTCKECPACRSWLARSDSSLRCSLLRISGLAALISIFRLEVGVHGSAGGVFWGFGGVARGWTSVRTGGEVAACFRGVFGTLLRERFSCAPRERNPAMSPASRAAVSAARGHPRVLGAVWSRRPQAGSQPAPGCGASPR